jgi:hypothetical protein
MRVGEAYYSLQPDSRLAFTYDIQLIRNISVGWNACSKRAVIQNARHTIHALPEQSWKV